MSFIYAAFNPTSKYLKIKSSKILLSPLGPMRDSTSTTQSQYAKMLEILSLWIFLILNADYFFCYNNMYNYT